MIRKITRSAFFTVNALVWLYSLCEAWDGFAEMRPTQKILSGLHSVDQSYGITETSAFIIKCAFELVEALVA